MLNVKDDEVGQAGSAVAITAVLRHGIITNSDNRALAVQFMLERAKSSIFAVSPRN